MYKVLTLPTFTQTTVSTLVAPSARALPPGVASVNPVAIGILSRREVRTRAPPSGRVQRLNNPPCASVKNAAEFIALFILKAKQKGLQ